MSRGRDTNIAYVALDQPDDVHTAPEPDDVSARTVLFGVLKHSGANLSAHQTMEAEYQLHGGIDRLAAELETIAADAQHDRFADLLSRSGLTEEQHGSVVESTAFGPLTASLRRAEAYHHDLERLVPRLVAQHALDDAENIAAVLRHRIDRAAASSPRGCRLRPRLVAGLIPAPLGEMNPDDRQAIDERIALIETRARALAEHGVAEGSAWVRRLGVPPPDRSDRERWVHDAATVAAYRDHYQIIGDLPLGRGAVSDAQRVERQRALQAATRAAVASGAGDRSQRRPVAEIDRAQHIE